MVGFRVWSGGCVVWGGRWRGRGLKAGMSGSGVDIVEDKCQSVSIVQVRTNRSKVGCFYLFSFSFGG